MKQVISVDDNDNTGSKHYNLNEKIWGTCNGDRTSEKEFTKI